MPCRHCSVCHQCLRSLRDEKCPLCRSVFSSYVTFPIKRAAPSLEEQLVVHSGGPPGPLPNQRPPQPPGGDNGDAGGAASDEGGDIEAGEATAGLTAVANANSASISEAPAIVAPADENSGGRRLGGDAASASRTAAAAAAERRAAAAAARLAASASTDPASSATQQGESPRTHVEPVRQARELQIGRPRGVAPVSRTTAQGLRRSGRARFSDRTDNADMPLLQEGASGAGAAIAPALGPGTGNRTGAGAVDGVATGSEECCRRDQAAPQEAAPTEETHILMNDSEVAA